VQGKTPVLIMIQGQEPGRWWPLAQTRVMTLGRSSRNQIHLLSPSVSRFHCEISYINGLWYIADLNSKKGTYLNGERILQRQVLRAGDVIRLSNNVFRFEVSDEATGPGSALLPLADAAPSVGADGEPASVGALRGSAPQQGAPSSPSVPAGYRLLPNAALVLAAALLALGGAAAAVAYGRHRVTRLVAARQRREAEAARALAAARELEQAGPDRLAEALEAYRQVVSRYGDSLAAGTAAARYRALEPTWVRRELERVTAAQAQGDFAGALERLDALRQGVADPTLAGLLEPMARLAERLARAAHGAARGTDEEDLAPSEALPAPAGREENKGAPAPEGGQGRPVKDPEKHFKRAVPLF